MRAADQINSEAGDSTLLPLSVLAKRLPAVRGDKPPSRTTLYRWATVGLKSRSGQCVRLEATLIGGTICASLDDVGRFSDSLDDVEWRPRVYRSRREESRLRKEGRAAIRQALAI